MRSYGRGICRLLSAGAFIIPWFIPWLGATAQATARRAVDGSVLDTHDRPVPFVTLTAPSGVTATTDDSGHFHLVVATRERLVFDVRRIGYMPTRVAISAGGDTSVSVLLLPGPPELGKVEVNSTAIQKSPTIAGFDERMRARTRGAGIGTFFTAKDIEEMHPIRTTAIFESQSSIFVHRTSVDQFAIYGKLTNGGECPANIFVDGVQMRTAGDLTAARSGRRMNVVSMVPSDSPVAIDQFLEPTDIAGIEVYARGLLVPQQFRVSDANAARCATIVFWTKHG